MNEDAVAVAEYCKLLKRIIELDQGVVAIPIFIYMESALFFQVP